MKIIKPAGTPWLNPGETLVCFGDSLTAAQNGYVSCLQQKLAAQNITVINAGRPGDKTPWAMTRLMQDVIERKPDAVSFYFGANDGVIGHGCWADEPTVSPITYKDLLVWMVHLCRSFGNIQKFSITIPPLRGEGHVFREFGFAYEPYARAAREAADVAGTIIVPLDALLYDAWQKHASEAQEDGLLFTRDGLHFTTQGYEMVAEAMLKAWDMK